MNHSFKFASEQAQFRFAGKTTVLELDVSGSLDEVDAAVGKAWEAFGGIDVLITNAGAAGKNLSQNEATVEETDLKTTISFLVERPSLNSAVADKSQMCRNCMTYLSVRELNGLALFLRLCHLCS